MKTYSGVRWTARAGRVRVLARVNRRITRLADELESLRSIQDGLEGALEAERRRNP